MSLLARWRAVVDEDGANLDLLLGPLWGRSVTCLRRNHTEGTEEACDWREYDLRLVAGAGLAFPVSRRLDASANLRFGLVPTLPVEEDGDADILDATLSLAVVYRLGTN